MTTTYVRFVEDNGQVITAGGADWATAIGSDVDGGLAAELANAQANGDVPTISLQIENSGIAALVQQLVADNGISSVEVATYDNDGNLQSDYLLAAKSFSLASSDIVTNDETLTFNAVAFRSSVTTNGVTSSDAYNFKSGSLNPGIPAPSAPAASTGLAAAASNDADGVAPSQKISYPYIVLEDASGTAIPTGSNVNLPQGLQQYDKDVFQPVDANFSVYLGQPGTGEGEVGKAFGTLSFSTDPSAFNIVLLKDLISKTVLKGAQILEFPSSPASSENAEVTLPSLQVIDYSVDIQPTSSQTIVTLATAGNAAYSQTVNHTTGSPTQAGATIGATPANAAPVFASGSDAIAMDKTITFGSGATAVTADFGSAAFTLQGGADPAAPDLVLTFSSAPSAQVQQAIADLGSAHSATIDEYNISSKLFQTYGFQLAAPTAAPTVSDNGDGTQTYTYSIPIITVAEAYIDTASKQVSSSNPAWDFITNQDGSTSFASDANCFYGGTHILTEQGEVAVETLKRGDKVVTSDGRSLPVVWLGVQTVSPRFANPLRVLPIRIKARALADNTPSRDLLLSPDHAVLIDDVLVQASALVNGSSIVRETNVAEIFNYYHVELDSHELLVAENTPAESFVDNVDRLPFLNWAQHEALHPGGKPIDELPYPRAKSHRQVSAKVRARLAQRASAIACAPTAA